MKNRAELEAEMREQSPAMFTHPGLQPGEVWIVDQVIDFALVNVALHRQHGMPSARFENETRTMVSVEVNGRVEKYPGHSMFVKLDELITVIEKDEREHPENKPRV
ncbi:MAG: hypothetical protein US18_C0029G0004 [Parcubacteria group bacterium GW2011_GWB1_36_5]|nr:MAG: hypothetical protein US12_C0012G0004 [Parcubacteria group bacterium GW2011_GWA2_36_24]KKQ06938.1 MAG: hypothetical protein US18_C0029G0004 [Parcubacteria group bacterium GW2011_GWB1_36_5]